MKVKRIHKGWVTKQGKVVKAYVIWQTLRKECYWRKSYLIPR